MLQLWQLRIKRRLSPSSAGIQYTQASTPISFELAMPCITVSTLLSHTSHACVLVAMWLENCLHSDAHPSHLPRTFFVFFSPPSSLYSYPLSSSLCSYLLLLLRAPPPPPSAPPPLIIKAATTCTRFFGKQSCLKRTSHTLILLQLQFFRNLTVTKYLLRSASLHQHRRTPLH